MRNDKYILDAEGNPVPCDLLTWAKWFEVAERHVADDVVGPSRVSTVFLGLDHSFGEGRPVLYETLVFEGPLDREMCRYSTKEEALAGHRAMIERVLEAL